MGWVPVRCLSVLGKYDFAEASSRHVILKVKALGRKSFALHITDRCISECLETGSWHLNQRD